MIFICAFQSFCSSVFDFGKAVFDMSLHVHCLFFLYHNSRSKIIVRIGATYQGSAQWAQLMFVCFVCLILYVPSTIFQLYRDVSSWVEPVLSYDKCVLLKDHNAVTPVRLEPAALRSRVKHSTTEPLRSQKYSPTGGPQLM